MPIFVLKMSHANNNLHINLPSFWKLRKSSKKRKLKYSKIYFFKKSVIFPSANFFDDVFIPLLSRDQVNLFVYGPDRPYFKQKQKNNIRKFWPTGFF